MLGILKSSTTFRITRPTGVFCSRMSFNISNYSTDAIADRYKSKLLEKAKAQGFNSVEELQESMKEKLQENRKAYDKIDPLKELEKYEQQVQMSKNIMQANKLRKTKNSEGSSRSSASANTNRGSSNVGTSELSDKNAPFKTLASYLELEKVKDLSPQEIEYLWRAKWGQTDGAMNAVVPLETFDKMLVKVKEHPVFVLPLPRANTSGEKDEASEGMELHYIQWQFPNSQTSHCLMTSLAEYKLHKEFARPHTTLEFHSELGKDKNIVLMNGNVEPSMNISIQEAQLLLLNVQRFYGAMGYDTPSSKQRLQLLKDFTNGSSDFNLDKLIILSQSMEN
ncbi:hypothetical protein TPHA_0P01460 [Tetrapisispora phaffii CBS 4417]|uniref:Uncharacterized protein n=1 Tax=Tetrapisispora phaffii (strain ATCC 24235 / CBS 4417 / NBRC 1672 / NRRL Y-8282 / UCD 70-5) TaxID=1071381 RepID=G8C2C6_TETPH|nr:hypothetical protein TPHA_0P01460 [Tetrapisispora phaffii CBS 4417]CCE66304.1 hypothetical protein TPHA_0P01460 [Tetrapisispora phaffii CBS 4417]